MKTILLAATLYVLLLSVTKTDREAAALDTPTPAQLKYPVSYECEGQWLMHGQVQRAQIEFSGITRIAGSRSDQASLPDVLE